jgi:hypothetical protein
MAHTRAGRNDPCPCGSGKKYKRCCESKQRDTRASKWMVVLVLAVVVGAFAAAFVSFSSDEGSSFAAPGRVWSPEHGHYH